MPAGAGLSPRCRGRETLQVQARRRSPAYHENKRAKPLESRVAGSSGRIVSRGSCPAPPPADPSRKSSSTARRWGLGDLRAAAPPPPRRRRRVAAVAAAAVPRKYGSPGRAWPGIGDRAGRFFPGRPGDGGGGGLGNHTYVRSANCRLPAATTMPSYPSAGRRQFQRDVPPSKSQRRRISAGTMRSKIIGRPGRCGVPIKRKFSGRKDE